MTEATDTTMAGVTDVTITIPVSVGQFRTLSEEQLYPGRARVTHKLAVGPHYLPGVWVVVAVQERIEPPQPTYLVTLARLEMS